MEQERPAENFYEELNVVRQQAAGQIGLAVTKWVIRWVFGFGIIAVITNYYAGFAWLWIAGAAVAAISLLVIFITHYMLKRKIGAVAHRIAEAESNNWGEED